MADRVTEFLASGTPGWELTKEDYGDCSHTLAIDMPGDPILVQWANRYYILNRDFISRPKIGGKSDNGTTEVVGQPESGNASNGNSG